MQSEIHWRQNAYTGRFQEYAPNYLSGDRITELIDIPSIDKVPIVMMAGRKDRVCPHKTARRTARTIGNAVERFESIRGADHSYFGSANDEWFMGKLISYLQVPESDNRLLEGILN